MAPSNDGKRVVRTYSDHRAPTGEGTILVDENGRHWRVYDHGRPPPRGTGDRQGYVSGGRHYEKP